MSPRPPQLLPLGFAAPPMGLVLGNGSGWDFKKDFKEAKNETTQKACFLFTCYDNGMAWKGYGVEWVWGVMVMGMG